MKSTLITTLTGLVSVLTAPPGAAETPHWPGPLGAYAAPYQACIAIYEPAADQYQIAGLAQCRERLSPCSTFKVPNALAGLEAGVLSGPQHRKPWDGTGHERTVLNQDHDLASAVKYSVVWYFQDVAVDIGPERMQAFLDAWDYGNRDISGGQDRFWLGRSLRISALEQIRFMTALSEGSLEAEPTYQAIVRKLIRQDYRLPEDFRGELYGKTGTCPDAERGHAWFTGFLLRDDRKFVFAVNLKGQKPRGWDARQIAVEVLHDLR